MVVYYYNLNTSNATNYTISNIDSYVLIRINISYYTSGLPDYGGITIPIAELRAARSEPIEISRVDNIFYLQVVYTNDTTISVRQVGGNSDPTACFSVHGVL